MHLRSVDGLRAFAVLAVVAHHLFPDAVRGGYLGVDIFFVISGYVITRSFHGFDGSAARFLVWFYERRARRILPALLVTVTLSAVLISLLDPVPTRTIRTGIAALLGLSNLYLLRSSVDYFGHAAELNIFTHTWSLGVEEQFYLVYPLLFAGLLLLDKGGKPSWRQMAWPLAALTALSALAYLLIGARQPTVAFFLSPLRFWELGAGALTFLLGRGMASPIPPAATGRIVMLLLAALLLLMVSDPRASHAANVAVVTISAAAIFLCAGDDAGPRLLIHPWSIWIGRISYSLYLWHWPLIILARWTIGVDLVSAPLVLLGMLAAATLSHRHVEEPFRRRPWLATGPRNLAAAASGGAVGVAFLALLQGPLGGGLYLGDRPSLIARGGQSIVAPLVIDGRWRWAGAPCAIGSAPDVGRPVSPARCTLGDPARTEFRILVLGNSYAAAMAESFTEIVRSGRAAVTITPAWGWPIVPEFIDSDLWYEIPFTSEHRWYWQGVVPEMLQLLQPGDWLLILGNMADFMPPLDRRDAAAEARSNLLRQGLIRWSADLRGRGIRLAILNGLTLVEESGCEPETAIGQWFAPFGPPCRLASREETLARRAPLDRMLRQLEQESVLRVVDLLDLFCPGPICGFQLPDGRVLYRDSYGHPSVEAARLAAGPLRAAFDRFQADRLQDASPIHSPHGKR